jgi:hypothetical protein
MEAGQQETTIRGWKALCYERNKAIKYVKVSQISMFGAVEVLLGNCNLKQSLLLS